MRELKFRAWDKVDERMWENVPLANGQPDLAFAVNYSRYEHYGSQIYVVMQYTGYNDSAQTNIYEGDILDYFGILRIVGWNQETGQWALKRRLDQDAKYYQQLVTIELNKSKVVGNIYENADLMEQK